MRILQENNLRYKIWYKFREKVDIEIRDQVGIKTRNQVWNPLFMPIYRQLKGEVWLDIFDQFTEK
jgi:hypothetical protein